MKLRIQSIKIACLALICASYASCNDDALMEASQKYAGKFELTVNQENPESRLELGQDGLTTQWEPGDQLVLVDKTRTLAPIFLNCTLTENSNTATFVAESGVPAGDYFVIYNHNDNLVYTHKPFQTVDDINVNNDLVLWNDLTILEGEDNATIELKHLYAKVNVELKNIPSSFYSDLYMGMYSSRKGFPINKQFTSAGLVDVVYGYNPNTLSWGNSYMYHQSNERYHNIPFGVYQGEWTGGAEDMSFDYSKGAKLSSLVLPANLEGEFVYFYVIYNNTCYEFKKAGVEFKAGTSYKVILDMADEGITTSTLNTIYDSNTNSYTGQLANAADWRHAAYRNGIMPDSYQYMNNYVLIEDIDFADEVFFPIPAHKLNGGNHKISNAKLEWENEDKIGLIRREWYGSIDNMNWDNKKFSYSYVDNTNVSVSDLILENVTFRGNNYVGALSGCNLKASNCEVIGSSVIEGNGNYVGGFVGFNSFTNTDLKFKNVRIGQNANVKGKNYVGGIVGGYVGLDHYNYYIDSQGSSVLLMESAKSEATITATEDYAGGIFGKIGGSRHTSYNNDSYISFSMEDYTYSLIKCVNDGSVTGRHYVGGIGGDFAVYYSGSGSNLDRIVLSQSCSTGNVIGESKVGGILGATMASTNICYSTGEISASTSTVGGIVGEISMGGSQTRIANSYSLATISGTNLNIGGIIGNAGGGAMGATVINSYYAADPDTYTFGGIVGYSGGSVSVINCLTTLNSLGANLGNHEYFGTKRDWMDSNNDGVADYDYNGDQVIDNYDLYESYMSMPDNVTNSIAAVTSILANKNIINGDNAYSSNYWDINLYPWYCVKFASFSADTNSPDYKEETIQ